MDDKEKEDWEYLKYRMKNEGFHYCFVHYSDFKEVKDEEFHKLRIGYLAAAKSLENYINEKADE